MFAFLPRVIVCRKSIAIRRGLDTKRLALRKIDFRNPVRTLKALGCIAVL